MLGGTNSSGMSLDQLFPVGAIYIGTMSTCPLQVLGIGTWTLKASDMVLQGAGNAGTVGSTVAAGLPNITGTWEASGMSIGSGDITVTGALGVSTPTKSGSDGYGSNKGGISFDASQSNNIYGNSSTVQPPAYIVNIWERTA